jgi:predicted RNA-binding Zn-ribbon protein involved in translation (DUF1610 family)
MITRNERLFSMFTDHVHGKDVLKIHKYTCNNCGSEVQVTEEITLRDKKTVFYCPKCGRREEFDEDQNI